VDGYSAYGSAELAAVYDAVYADRHDVAFWRTIAAASGGSILELGCGTGRVLVALARAGHEVVGLDDSPHMLEVCLSKLEAQPAGVRSHATVIDADMTSFDLARTFEAIICPLNGFHHLRTAEDQIACLDACRKHLPAHGLLILDLFNPDPALAPSEKGRRGDDAIPSAEAETVEWTGGRRIRRWMSGCRYDRPSQCNECEMTYEIVEADGTARRIAETFPLRIVYRYELEHLLVRCGFKLLTVYGDYDRSPFGDRSLGMIAVAGLRGA
jgi:SAM-dependent methyltransferase